MEISINVNHFMLKMENDIDKNLNFMNERKKKFKIIEEKYYKILMKIKK